MQIVSYRGPTQPGGVSNALTQIDYLQNQQSNWFYIVDHELWIKNKDQKRPIYAFDKIIQKNHYYYCNNFLWPIMHDMPELARYSLVERLHYKVFNSSLALNLNRPDHLGKEAYFVNDYQLALLPKFLNANQNKYIFWHIPWPKDVWPQHADAIGEIAEALLSADAIGFHTEEYKDNFENFVRQYLPFAQVSSKLIVSPLGIDNRFWQENATENPLLPATNGVPYVLSVDRVDYTKGVRERLLAINHFFKTNPEWQEKVVFVQQCARSRPGLSEFDKYWHECRSIYQSVNSIYSKDAWKPILWTDKPTSPPELASSYANASIMLVNPLKDGLNLTAKEFVASQQSNPGVLTLSNGAGVWSELGNHCLSVRPKDLHSFAHKILYGLNMSIQEKKRRQRSLRNCVAANSLSMWWQKFVDLEKMSIRNRDEKLNQTKRMCV